MKTSDAVRSISALVLGGGIAATSLLGCSSTPEGDASGDGRPYLIALTVAGLSGLPVCGGSHASEIAYVESPPGLWKCVGARWLAIPCNGLDTGSVAYASATNALVACVGGAWTPIALPPGPEGPAGPPGAAAAQPFIRVTPIPPGPICAAGGTLVSIGLSDVVTETAVVCNGVSGAADGGADATVGDASDAAACGQIGAACCTTGTPCEPPVPGVTVLCQGGTCTSCGGTGEPCCTSAPIVCRGPVDACFQGTCQTCGVPNGPCCALSLCPPGTSGFGSGCGRTGYVCSGVGGTCIPCGLRGQSCCTNRGDVVHVGAGVCGGPLCADGSTCLPGPHQCQ